MRNEWPPTVSPFLQEQSSFEATVIQQNEHAISNDNSDIAAAISPHSRSSKW
jgi:hypothetical protein